MRQNKTEKLNQLLDQLGYFIPQFETLNPSVSNANIGWHIEHALMVLNGIIEATAKSDPNQYRWSCNYRRYWVLLLNKIPRGKAKAPKSVLPNNGYTLESLQERLQQSRSKISELQNLSKDKYFEHPGLGNMKLKQTIRFIEIHTRHHFDIIKEIGEE